MGWLSDLIDRWFPRPVPPRPTPPVPPPPPDPDADPTATLAELLERHNKQRAGAAPLRLHTLLNLAAQRHSQWQADHHTMTHAGDGSLLDRIRAAGYRARVAGENIAAGYPTAASVVAGWMGSPGHRRNILNAAFVDVGFGMATSTRGVRYWTAVFASPASPVAMTTLMGDSSNTEATVEFYLSGPLMADDVESLGAAS
jgi:uncharacterized protein YkwD